MKDEELCTRFIGIPLTKFLSIVLYCHLLKLSLRSGIIVWSLQIVLVIESPVALLDVWRISLKCIWEHEWYNMYSSWWRNSVLKIRLCSFLFMPDFFPMFCIVSFWFVCYHLLVWSYYFTAAICFQGQGYKQIMCVVACWIYSTRVLQQGMF